MVANNISHGPPPNLNDEVEQDITVNGEGQVCFSAYKFDVM